MRWRAYAAGAGLVIGVLVTCPPVAIATSSRGRRPALRKHPVTAAAAPVAVSLQAPPGLPVSGQLVTLTGQVSGLPAGTGVQLQQSPYPYDATVQVQTTTTQPDGSFTFAVFPDRDTRYLVAVAGSSAAATVQVDVTGTALTTVKALSLGRAKVTVVVFHPADLRWGDAPTRWWFASGSHGGFRRARDTHTVRLSRNVAVLSTTVALSAGRFRWRACFFAPGDAALENPRRPPGCFGRGYHGGGSLPAGFPGPAAIDRAERYLERRMGRTALAVVDSEGRISGVNLHRTFITGSVVKAMLLVAYLRRLDAMGQRRVDGFSNSFLYPMINVSDNAAATRCWSIVGNVGVLSVAAAAGMTNFSVTTDWGSARFSAADQARFFFAMDSLIPPEFVTYARRLLSTIADYESWGIPAVARPLGYTVFFKGGWRPSPDIFLVHQIARLEGHHHTFSMAVMTDGDADMGYGIDTIQGVTRALLG